jgi:hypothetical protein
MGMTIEAVSLLAVGSAGVTGALANWLMKEKLIDDNYRAVLQFIIQELAQKWESDEKEKGSNQFQEVSDFRRDGKTYSLEKALLLLYTSSKGLANFEGTNLKKCTKGSLEALIKRIECIRTIHEIRNLLASQCYIGIVGIQDAGTFNLIR